MNRFFYFVDKFKYGIVAVLVVYTGMFMYLQLATYPEYVEIIDFTEGARLIQPKEEVELKAENIEVPLEFSAGEVKNTVRDMKDQRERSEEDFSTTKETSNGEKFARETEQKYKDEARSSAYNKEVAKLIEDRKKEKEIKKDIKKEDKPKNDPNSGGKNAAGGNVMVDYSFSSERAPHQNNIWFVRCPGYTCGENSSGRVVIDIKVGQDGRVISAVYNPSGSSSVNFCMQEQAQKYAKMSRFSAVTTAGVESGKIFYTFVTQ